ncbi:3793_t:CDS:2 [Diversispora eburnea]|uniref:threonine--tRNA ligase n=1 Tax=Diversispora eburnea TaxID=1213867 RepID=A0A9N8YXG3_9GLOM|nr:3793_t:CDS:2 [Diversispora eburnea]
MLKNYWHFRKNNSFFCSFNKILIQIEKRNISSVNINRRLLEWKTEKKRQSEIISNSNNDTKDIDILVDGTLRKGLSGITTPYECAKGISHKLADNSIIALVNSKDLYEMNRPLYDSCSLNFLPFSVSNTLTTEVFWHSTAHVIGSALEIKYGDDVLLCDGPPLKQGGFPEKDLQDILKIMKECVARKHPFERMQVTKNFARELFFTNPFKLHYISQIPENESIIIYKCGSFIDLCRGPHIPHTGFIRTIELSKYATAYWKPDLAYDKNSPQSINRIYGISFANTNEFNNWKKDQEEAQKRDHRLIGKFQQLYLIHHLSPGSVFMLPHGTRIFQKLQNYIRLKYREFGFEEVMTPMIYKKDLWEMSGHWQNYKNEMFTVDYGENFEIKNEKDEIFGLKPMNCPGHCLIFDNSPKSYRDLPVRIADFGSLHRNEISGNLTGLTRVRQFHQDDAHIFCRKSQIFDEIISTLSFVDHVYNDLKFPNYQFLLSTRHETQYIGDISEWEIAEESLKKALEASGKNWIINPGDAAFYGPKIDITIKDAFQRMHQTATIQLDFQLPQRFKLKYIDENSTEQTPIIIHRAILGSIERMMAILIENTGGKWPFWLNPRQVIVIPVSPKFSDYAQKEKDTQTVNVRPRDDKNLGNMTIDQLLMHFERLNQQYL